ncbi:MAG TPA: DsbC family protein [Usitatibacter sp.]|jgi:thiol:disulfide interchange protein DsbC
MKITAFVAALAAAAILPLHAQVDPNAIKAEIQKKLPEAPVESVQKTPYGNLYEVVAGGEIFYTDANASFILLGPIVDLKTRKNVTEQRMAQLNAIDFKSLPLDHAIKIVRGNGSRKIALFEDPNCGYCKRFERDFQGVTDVTAYVFLYPILAPDSVEKSKAIWCSADPGKAWIDTMVHDKLPATEGKCETPLQKNLELGHKKRIRGTPTLVFEDGERIPGAISMADLEKRFAQAKAKVASSK